MLLNSRLRRVTSACAIATLSLGTLTAFAAEAQAAPVATANSTGGEIRSGDDWSVTDLGGAYEIVLDLDAPLDMRSDAPTIVVDGKPLGLAQESADGRSLTVVYRRPWQPAAARTVTHGWSSDAGTVDVDASPHVDGRHRAGRVPSPR